MKNRTNINETKRKPTNTQNEWSVQNSRLFGHKQTSTLAHTLGNYIHISFSYTQLWMWFYDFEWYTAAVDSNRNSNMLYVCMSWICLVRAFDFISWFCFFFFFHSGAFVYINFIFYSSSIKLTISENFYWTEVTLQYNTQQIIRANKTKQKQWNLKTLENIFFFFFLKKTELSSVYKWFWNFLFLLIFFLKQFVYLGV